MIRIKRYKSSRKQLLGCPLALCVLLLVITQFACIASGTPSQSREWKAKYKMGTGLESVMKDNSKLKVTMDDQTILCQTKKGAGLLILIQPISEVSYDNVARRRISTGDLIRSAASDLFAIGFTGPETALLCGAKWALSSAFKRKNHFVNILWREQNDVKEAVFELGKNDYLSFLDQLQSVSGKEWKKLPQLRERVQQELEEKNTRKCPYSSITGFPLVRWSSNRVSTNWFLSKGRTTAGFSISFAARKLRPRKSC